MIFWFFLVSALVPGLVSLLVSLLVSSFFAQKRSLFHHDFQLLAGSGSGSGAFMISSFLLVPALVPGLVSLLVSCLPSCLFFLCSKKESVPS